MFVIKSSHNHVSPIKYRCPIKKSIQITHTYTLYMRGYKTYMVVVVGQTWVAFIGLALYVCKVAWICAFMGTIVSQPNIIYFFFDSYYM
jgi:hypothetical protein